MKSVPFLFSLAVSALLLCGCESAYQELDADPLPPTSFLPDHQLLVRQNPAFPFQSLWYRQGVDWQRFKKIKIDKVDTSHMLASNWWQSVNEANVGSMRAEAEQIGQYMRNAFIREIISDPLHSFVITDSVDSETVVVQLALVQLVPTKAFFNAVATTAGIFIPGAGLLSMGDAGCVAMECKIVDGRDGHLLAMLADREKDRAILISADNYTWYGHSKDIIDVWAKDFAEMAVHRSAKRMPRKEFPITIISI